MKAFILFILMMISSSYAFGADERCEQLLLALEPHQIFFRPALENGAGDGYWRITFLSAQGEPPANAASNNDSRIHHAVLDRVREDGSIESSVFAPLRIIATRDFRRGLLSSGERIWFLNLVFDRQNRQGGEPYHQLEVSFQLPNLQTVQPSDRLKFDGEFTADDQSGPAAVAHFEGEFFIAPARRD